MPDYDEMQKNLSQYRIQRAEEDLAAAKLLYRERKFRIANNRAYYAIFHALRAVLILDGFDTGKHSGIIGEFRRRYIKEGIFPSEVSKMIGSAFTIRNASDYDDMFIASANETEEQINNALYICNVIREYLTAQGVEVREEP